MTNALQMAVDWAELESTVTVKLNLNFALGDEDEHLDDKADKDKKQAQKEQKKKEGDTIIQSKITSRNANPTAIKVRAVSFFLTLMFLGDINIVKCNSVT